jgi:hypothetical protein
MRIEKKQVEKMNLDEANAVLDRLNNVFSGVSTNIPEAKEIYSAINTLIMASGDRGGDKRGIPCGISENGAVLNKKTVDLIEELRTHANLVVETHKNAEKLKNELKGELPLKVQKKLKI